jgi:hypothetical protein
LIKKLWNRVGWPRRLYDEKTNSEVWMLWMGRWATGWGRPFEGKDRTVNRLVLLGRPYLKSFGRWERLRPGRPTSFQIAGSIFSRVRSAGEVLDFLLGDREAPRGWSRQRLSKQQRILLTRVRSELVGVHTDAEYLIPEEKPNGKP